MRRILVIRFGALGDLVLGTVLLAALREAHPRAEIWWVTKERWAPLLRADGRIDRLVVLPEGGSLGGLLAELESVPFDLVLDAHANLRSRALCALLPPTPVRRLEKDGLARWILLRGGPVLPGLRRRLVDRLLDLVPELGPERRGRLRPRIVPGTDALGRASEWTGDERRWIAVAPGAKHPTKQWPAERFAALCGRLADEGFGVIVMGGPDEATTIARVVDDARDAGPPQAVRAWPVDRSLDESAAVLGACDLLVGNDSGLVHLAEAVGTPAVVLFGPTVREWGYFPLDPRSVVVERPEVPCRPCSKVGDRPCHQTQRWCLTRSTVDEVWRRVGQALHGPPEREDRWNAHTG